MKTIHILFLLLTLTTFSCKKNHDAEFKKLIIGEWKFAKNVDSSKQIKSEVDIPEQIGLEMRGYQFNKNGTCEDKMGYIYIDEANGYENRKIYYLGNETKYKIEEDSLKIFNLESKKWATIKIFSITKDTLTLQNNDSLYAKYVKTDYKPDPNEKYDKIIVSSSGCYGICPVASISLDRDGSVLYQGFSFTTNIGLFSSKISKEEYLKTENRFKKASIDNLDTDYSANHTDDQTIYVTFIKNNRIYKTILDYGHKSPVEFQWAYSPVRYLDQKLRLQAIVGNLSNQRRLYFETATKICSLNQSESFFLITELNEGKETHKKITPKYRIEYLMQEKVQTVETDGRYYIFTNSNGSKTIDIGYNFLEQNNFYKNFKKKEKQY